VCVFVMKNSVWQFDAKPGAATYVGALGDCKVVIECNDERDVLCPGADTTSVLGELLSALHVSFVNVSPIAVVMSGCNRDIRYSDRLLSLSKSSWAPAEALWGGVPPRKVYLGASVPRAVGTQRATLVCGPDANHLPPESVGSSTGSSNLPK
jgi:hypothetical protein